MDDYESYMDGKDKKNKVPFKIFDNAKPIHIVLLAILVYVGSLIAKNNDSKWVYGVLIGFGVLYLFSVMKQTSGDSKPIPRGIAQQIAHNDLLKEIDAGRCFVAGTTVTPTGYFKDQSWDSGEGPKLFKYNIGFKVKEPNCGPREIIYQMHPFTGESKGIIEQPLGFTGQDIKDIQQIFPEKLIKEEVKK